MTTVPLFLCILTAVLLMSTVNGQCTCSYISDRLVYIVRSLFTDRLNSVISCCIVCLSCED